MFCPSSLFLQICYRNIKAKKKNIKATSGTAESHLKTIKQNKQKTRFIYYCVFVVCIGGHGEHVEGKELTVELVFSL